MRRLFLAAVVLCAATGCEDEEARTAASRADERAASSDKKVEALEKSVSQSFESADNKFAVLDTAGRKTARDLSDLTGRHNSLNATVTNTLTPAVSGNTTAIGELRAGLQTATDANVRQDKVLEPLVIKVDGIKQSVKDLDAKLVREREEYNAHLDVLDGGVKALKGYKQNRFIVHYRGEGKDYYRVRDLHFTGAKSVSAPEYRYLQDGRLQALVMVWGVRNGRPYCTYRQEYRLVESDGDHLVYSGYDHTGAAYNVRIVAADFPVWNAQAFTRPGAACP